MVAVKTPGYPALPAVVRVMQVPLGLRLTVLARRGAGDMRVE